MTQVTKIAYFCHIHRDPTYKLKHLTNSLCLDMPEHLLIKMHATHYALTFFYASFTLRLENYVDFKIYIYI